MAPTKSSTPKTCKFKTFHSVTKEPMYCQNSISTPRTRQWLCQCHLQLHDISHQFYKDMEGKRDTSLRDHEQAWALRLMHGFCFFGSVESKHREYMSQIAGSEICPLIFPRDDDFWSLLPTPTCPVTQSLLQSSKDCVETSNLPGYNDITHHLVKIVTVAIFKSISEGKLWNGERGFVQQTSHFYFPMHIIFQNRYFMTRLEQNCPNIFYVISVFEPFFEIQPNNHLSADIYAFYHGLVRGLLEKYPIDPDQGLDQRELSHDSDDVSDESDNAGWPSDNDGWPSDYDGWPSDQNFNEWGKENWDACQPGSHAGAACQPVYVTIRHDRKYYRNYYITKLLYNEIIIIITEPLKRCNSPYYTMSDCLLLE